MEGYFFRQDPKRAPGDFGGHGFLGVGRNFIFDFDPIEFKDPAVRKTKLHAEIANGRLAMVAIMVRRCGSPAQPTTASWAPRCPSSTGTRWALPRRPPTTRTSAAVLLLAGLPVPVGRHQVL